MVIRFFKPRIVELAITAVSLIICCSIFTLVADDYGAFGYNLASGQFSDYPYIESHYLGLIGISKILEILYILLPAYNWLGISFVTFQTLALYLALRSIKTIVLTDSKHIYLLRIVQILFSLFFVENIISISHTRYSLLLCGIGLFNLVFTRSINLNRILLNTAIFVLGMLIRPESSLGMLLLVSIGYLIYRFDVKFLIIRFYLPSIATAVLFLTFFIDWSTTDIYVRKVEPEIEYKIMGKRIIDISTLKSAEDSVKYEAAMVGMWFDLNVMTPEFLRSLLLPGINLSRDHATKIFFHTVSYYKHYVFILCLITAMILLCFFQTRSRKTALKILLLHIATFIVIFSVDFNGRLIAERHFLNLQLISLLITAFYFFSAINLLELWIQHKHKALGCILFILTGASITTVNYTTNNNKIAHETDCYELAMQEIENMYSDRLVVSTLSNVYLLNHNFSIMNNNYTKNTYILFDVFTYSLLPKYMEYLSRKCNCNPANPIIFFNWLAEQDALYIAEPERYTLTERYMRLVHDYKLKFISPDSLVKPTCVQSTEMKEYQIKNIVVQN